MKKTIKIVIIILLAICIAAGLFVAVKLSKDWPEDAVYADTKFYTDDGVYYIKNHTQLVFYDYGTNTENKVCAKPNCEHDDTSCNSYYDAFTSYIMVYNDKLYVAYSPLPDEEDLNDEGTLQKLDRNTYIEVSELDGSNRKTIYTSNCGNVLSMCAIGDKLYFTEFQYHDVDNHEMNTEYTYSYLFCYDLTWGTTKELICYDASDENYSSSMEIMYYDTDAAELYILHSYKDITDESDEKIYEQIISYNDGNAEAVFEFPENTSINLESAYLTDEGMFCSYAEDYYDLYDDAKYEFVLMDMSGNVLQKLAEYADGSIYNYGSWYMILLDDVNKLMYDTENDKWYIGNIEETWIPDIAYVNPEEDIIFYDKTDYTGMEPGTLLTENPVNYTSGSWSEFLAEHFTEYDGTELDWITVY